MAESFTFDFDIRGTNQLQTCSIVVFRASHADAFGRLPWPWGDVNPRDAEWHGSRKRPRSLNIQSETEGEKSVSWWVPICATTLI